MTQDLATAFRKYFRILSAESPAIQESWYRLRYQVYCIETGFEDAGEFPDGLERDVYDRRSVQSIVTYTRTHPHTTAAGVRLVLADPDDPDLPFPIEAHCRIENVVKPGTVAEVDRVHLAEISRFAVSKHFKRRVGEPGTTAGVGPETKTEAMQRSDGRLVPHLTLGLFAAIVRMSAEQNITHWYAVMEPALLRLLTRFGITFQKLGPMVDYHGRRQPCFGKIDDVLAGILGKRPDVWHFITGGGQIWPAPGGRGEWRRQAF